MVRPGSDIVAKRERQHLGTPFAHVPHRCAPIFQLSFRGLGFEGQKDDMAQR